MFWCKFLRDLQGELNCLELKKTHVIKIKLKLSTYLM